MLIRPSFKKSLIVEQLQGNYLKLLCPSSNAELENSGFDLELKSSNDKLSLLRMLIFCGTAFVERAVDQLRNKKCKFVAEYNVYRQVLCTAPLLRYTPHFGCSLCDTKLLNPVLNSPQQKL